MLEVIILIIIVLIGFVAVSWYTNQRSQERANAFERELDFEEKRDKETFQQRFDALFDQELEEKTTRRQEHDLDLFDDFSEPESALPEFDDDADVVVEEDDESDWEMVVAFTIMAPDSNLFSGRAVKAALEKQDFHFGDMQIYHKYTAGNKKQTLFSAANILAPGTLLPNEFVSMSSPGLLLFARFPGPVSGMALFDELLDTAQNMTDDLGGVLCDENREPITQEALETIRKRIFDYQLSVQGENQDPHDYHER